MVNYPIAAVIKLPADAPLIMRGNKPLSFNSLTTPI